MDGDRGWKFLQGRSIVRFTGGLQCCACACACACVLARADM